LDAPPKPEGFAFAGGEPASAPAQKVEVEALPQNIESHLVKAIIASMCCCLPIGIAAIYYSAQVDSNLRRKDLDGALEASKKASIWGNLAIGIGIPAQLLLYWLIRSSFLNYYL
jgi:hypothetical protein